MATPGQQAAAALQSGGVTRFADTNPNHDDGIQLAGFLFDDDSQKVCKGRGSRRDDCA